eukprot:416472_1
MAFPEPSTQTEYHQNQPVWAFINSDLPYWPALIVKISDENITIQTFADPSNIPTEDDIINGITRRATRKKRVTTKSNLLQWNALTNDGEAIDYDNVINEFVLRKQLKNVDEIDEILWEWWNNKALEKAEGKIVELHTIEQNQKKLQLEMEELERHRQEEIEKANAMEGQIYDGRTINDTTGDIHGYTLHAGDMIRYWKCLQMNNENMLISTKIIQVYDKYGTLKHKNTVPIVVETEFEPPFWDTEIELLPTEDEMNPIFWPLYKCKLVPGQVENILKKKHEGEVQEWEDKMKNSKFGSMMIVNNRNKNRNMNIERKEKKKRETNKKKKRQKNKKKKRKTQTKRRMSLSDKNVMDSNDSDTLNNEMNDNVNNDMDKYTKTFPDAAIVKLVESQYDPYVVAQCIDIMQENQIEFNENNLDQNINEFHKAFKTLHSK